MGEYLKNEFGVAGCTGHGDTGLQNTENAYVTTVQVSGSCNYLI